MIMCVYVYCLRICVHLYVRESVRVSVCVLGGYPVRGGSGHGTASGRERRGRVTPVAHVEDKTAEGTKELS